jgi:predicted small metal-binding protein
MRAGEPPYRRGTLAAGVPQRRRGADVKQFACNVLVPGCEAQFEGESEDEILEHVTVHARDEHGLDEVPPEIEDQIRAAISER